MSEGLHLPDGHYVVPEVGPRLALAEYPESSLYVQNGELSFKSALFGDTQSFAQIFPDPRAAAFADVFTRHQLRLLDVRQLSLPERFETRDGAGRMDRLTTLLDSAKAVARLGGTFEQIVQVLVSDANVTVGSHRLGDHLNGDYIHESTMDEGISDYLQKSGLLGALTDAQLTDSNGQLTGSPMNIFALASPNTPRRRDIVECPRPYSNADRDPFTLIEGLYLKPAALIQEAARSMIRAEVMTPQGLEERIAYSSLDAARLVHELSVRHASEHWADAEHNLITEIVSAADKFRLLDLWPRPAIDALQITESEWFDGYHGDGFVANMYQLAEYLGKSVKLANIALQNGDCEYRGPGAYAGGITFTKSKTSFTHPVMSVTKNQSGIWLTANLPAHKYRQPIDALVATKSGLMHVTDTDPKLVEYAKERMQWQGAYIASLDLSKIDGVNPDSIRRGLARVNMEWHFNGDTPAALKAAPMPADMFAVQIDRSRAAVIANARH